MSKSDQLEGGSLAPVRRDWRQRAALTAILFAAVAVLSLIPIVHQFEARLGDTLFRLAPVPKQASQVIVVLIDEESLHTYGRWPWSRTLLAQLTSNLSAASAQVIGLDILLSEPQASEPDRALGDALRKSGRTVIVDKIGNFPEGPRWIEPLPEFAQWAGVGHAQAVLDPDIVCRRFPPLELTLDGPRWAFAIELARKAAPQQTARFISNHGFSESDSASPIGRAKPTLIPIPFRRDGFQTISARTVLDHSALSLVRGRPVLVGFGSVEIGDRLATPLSSDLPAPGVEIHAQILDSILTGRTLREFPLWLDGLLWLVICALSVRIVQHGYGWDRFAYLTAAVVSIYAIALFLYWFVGRMMPVGALVMAVVLAPMVVYSAELVIVERSVTRQLLSLRMWLHRHERDYTRHEGPLSWKLELLQDLQTELGAAYELHRALLEAMQDLVAIFDGNGNLLLSNDIFAAACLAIVERRTLNELRERLSLDTNTPTLEQGLTWEQEVYFEKELYLLHLAPLPPTFLSPSGGTVLRMTSLRTREERDRARAEALGFITHELRTPLTSIQGFAELMTRYPDSPACAVAPQTIVRESKRLLAVISSYLDLLQVDAGAKSLQKVEIDVRELVSQVFDILQPLATANRMWLTLQVMDESALRPLADPSLINGAVLNLVSNAIKYGRAGTEIIASCWNRENETVIAVYNQGEPIPADSISRLFDPYYRAPESGKVAPGWGIGLAFVKRIAEKHGGSVTVESNVTGTTLEIHLPADASVGVSSKVSA
jgi:signal transduction histidine kinase/CHASE2 domain-containing sensor protein